MSLVGRVGRGFLRGVAAQLAARAARAELFERPGERAQQAPLFVGDTAADGADADAASSSAEEQPADGRAPAPAPERRVAPASLTDIEGLRTTLAGLERLTVVNHWATWCIPCIEEFGHLKALHDRVTDRVGFLGVSWDLFDPRGDEDDIREHVENFGTGQSLPWGSVVLGEGVSSEAFFEAFDLSFHQIPQTWVVAPGGAVVHRVDGVIAAGDVDALVELLETHLAD